MFKYIALFALFAVALAAPGPKPLFATAPVVAGAPLAYTAGYAAPVAYSAGYAAPVVKTAYAAPVAYSAGYPGYAGYAAAPVAAYPAYSAYPAPVVKYY